jgi:hypothetical protein
MINVCIDDKFVIKKYTKVEKKVVENLERKF